MLLVLGGEAPPAHALSFNGIWEHTVSGDEESETRSSLKQMYRVSDGIAFEPTRAIAGSASISYNRTQATNKPRHEILSPGGTLGLANDIFRLGLSGAISQERREGAPDFDITRWRSSLAPASYPWRRDLWPAMSVYYGESQTTSPGRIDAHETYYGGSMHLALPDDVNVFYSYDLRQDKDNRTQRVTDTGTHTGQFRTSGSLWHDRFSVRFTQGITQESVTDSGIVPPTGIVEEVPQVSFTYYSVVDESDPGFVTHDFALSDHENSMLGNLQNTTTFAIGPEQFWHLGVSPVFAPNGEQQVDQFRVYVDDELGELVMGQSALHWDLYASFDSPIPGLIQRWEPIAADVNATYNSVDQRFEVDIPTLNQDYLFLMVVMSNRSPLGVGEVTVNVRAVQSVPLSTATPGSSFSNKDNLTTHTSAGDMRLEISPTLRASSNLSFRYAKGYYNGLVHGTLHWTPSSMIAPSLSFTEIRRDSDLTEETINRSSSLSVPIILLKTVHVNLGATRSARFTDGRRNSIRDNYFLGISATLYPDLTASLNEQYSTGEARRGDGTITENESFSSDLTLKARLTPKLSSELGNFLQKTFKPEPIASTVFYSDLKTYYRLSDSLSMDLRLQKYWTGEGRNSLHFSLRMALLRARKTRVDFTSQYRHVETLDDQKFFSLQGSWDISKHFTLKSHASYSIAKINGWSVLTSLYVRL